MKAFSSLKSNAVTFMLGEWVNEGINQNFYCHFENLVNLSIPKTIKLISFGRLLIIAILKINIGNSFNVKS